MNQCACITIWVQWIWSSIIRTTTKAARDSMSLIRSWARSLRMKWSSTSSVPIWPYRFWALRRPATLRNHKRTSGCLIAHCWCLMKPTMSGIGMKLLVPIWITTSNLKSKLSNYLWTSGVLPVKGCDVK